MTSKAISVSGTNSLKELFTKIKKVFQSFTSYKKGSMTMRQDVDLSLGSSIPLFLSSVVKPLHVYSTVLLYMPL